jgi:addiction module HigA family antidote
MIKSFRCKETGKIFGRIRSGRFPSEIQRIALRKLMILDAATTLSDLRIPPADAKGNTASGSMTSGGSVSVGNGATPAKLRLLIITKGAPIMAYGKMKPVHPGEVLQEDFLGPMGLSQYRLAKDISVSPRRINEIVHGKRAISADTALRLARFFGTSEQFWLNLQSRFDLETERDHLGLRLAEEVQVYKPGG